jgi:Domain of unknown function (DUF397)
MALQRPGMAWLLTLGYGTRPTFIRGQRNCVEVCTGQPGLVGVRDSKGRSKKELKISEPAWSAFVQGVKRGEFDRG